MAGELRVVASAGHVDHGKSSLIVRLTGIDPDRFAEEKRRGLTIDLGYAWCVLPSGREVGFVDVPGHERFIANMLAGVGPVRLVLFVVAADEGWKPQSEEHLQILDVLGASGGVVALSKRDLVDADRLASASDEVKERLRGTSLGASPIVPVSSTTGEGLDDLRAALDSMLATTPPPPETRTRLFVDRVFTIKGAGTVVTGTLEGACLAVGDDVEVYPAGLRARIRSLQTHKKSEERACPVHRVAANLVGVERADLRRGDVVGLPGSWRATASFDAELRGVRSLERPVSARGAFKLYAGAAEVDARLRFYGAAGPTPDRIALARIHVSRPLPLDVGDRFVIRDSGRQATVAGGRVLDVQPPREMGKNSSRLVARGRVARDELPALLVTERGAVRADEAFVLTGSRAHGATTVIGDHLVDPEVVEAAGAALAGRLSTFHSDHPLVQGMPLEEARSVVMHAIRSEDRDLVDAIIAHLPVGRTASLVHSLAHHVALDTSSTDVARIVSEVAGSSPPLLSELIAAGHSRELIDAAARSGLVVRVGPDLVFAADTIARARAWVDEQPEGFTVSAFREALGTSRKYAVPLLEWFDQQGITRRSGDVRFPRR